jgi:hypothetical protein
LSFSVQYKKLYTEVSAENETLRAENGDLGRRLSSHADALRKENATLAARVDRAQQELERLRQQLARRVCGGCGGSIAPGPDEAGATSEKDLEGIAEDQNLFEVRIEKGELEVSADVGTFFTLDFYDHPTQARIASPLLCVIALITTSFRFSSAKPWHALQDARRAA